MTGSERGNTVVVRRIARRVDGILADARDRERRGQSLALDIDARFRLEDTGAVQFQVASAILEETGGLEQEEVVGELLSLGLAAVLSGAAKLAGQRSIPQVDRPELFLETEDEGLPDFGYFACRSGSGLESARVLN